MPLRNIIGLVRSEVLPERRPWVEPLFVDHLFYAPVSEGAENITVEATDRFGRVYAGGVGA